MSPNAAVPRFGAQSPKADPTPLGQPLVFPFSKRTAPNRFLNAAMSEHLASFDETDVASRGVPSEELIRLYERWGEGGWGQVLTGNVMIHPEHLEGAGNTVIPPGSEFHGLRFERYAALATAAKRHGSLIVAQVSHPGRQTPATIQPHPISASAVQLKASAMGDFAMPREATREDIAGVIEGFAHTAEYLEKAGFDGIQLHGAHGYLLAQFLSESTNQRTDEYGGSLANRMRLILEVSAAIRKRVSPNFILGIKVNSVEFQDRGFPPEEAVKLCRALEEEGRFDYVETSGGTYESFGFHHSKASTQARENFFIDFAERIHAALTVTRVYTTGGFKTTAAMADAVRGGAVDGIGIGRAAGQEPDLPKAILEQGVPGIMQYAIDENDFLTRMSFAGHHIQQLARGEEPADLTDKEVVARGPNFAVKKGEPEPGL